MAFINFYKILQLSTHATAHEIKRAYRQLAKMWHPDRNQGSKSSEEKFKEIQKAYETLSNPVKKKSYDYKYQKELAKDKAERKAAPHKKDFHWQSAQSYQSQLNNLWQQYENLNKDRKRAFGQAYTEKKEKYYYYNNERISAEEFRAKAQKDADSSSSSDTKSEEPQVSIHYIDPYKRNIPWWQQAEIIGLWGLFINLVIFMLFPRQIGLSSFLPLILLGAIVIIIKWWQTRNPIHNIIIEIRADRITRRGRGLLETTLFFEDIVAIKDLASGMYLGTQAFTSPPPFPRRMAISHEAFIFIPIAIQNFEGIRRFLLSLEPSQAV